jgi:hypothetical protein
MSIRTFEYLSSWRFQEGVQRVEALQRKGKNFKFGDIKEKPTRTSPIKFREYAI